MWKTGSKTGAQAVVSITPTLSKYKTYLLFAIIQNVTNDIKTINTSVGSDVSHWLSEQ
jgi:hypothetical protein